MVQQWLLRISEHPQQEPRFLRGLNIRFLVGGLLYVRTVGKARLDMHSCQLSPLQRGLHAGDIRFLLLLLINSASSFQHQLRHHFPVVPSLPK